MIEEKVAGCARPTGAQVGEKLDIKKNNELFKKEDFMDIAKVGTKAPDFVAPSYFKGSFTSIKLSDYLGKWVLLCFYPGDFTFV